MGRPSGQNAGCRFLNGLSWRFGSLSCESESRMQPGSVYRERTLWQAFPPCDPARGCGDRADHRRGQHLRAGTALAESGSCGTWKRDRHLGSVSALWEWHLKRAFAEEIFDAAGIASQLSQAKMVAVTTDFMHGVRWAELLDRAKELDLFVFSGRTWRSSLDQYLLRLGSQPKSKINLLLPDPADATTVGELSRRFLKGTDEVIAAIDETRTLL